MAKDFLKKLQELEGAVRGEYNPFNHTIRTPSPSTNFTLGNTHGLPLGYSCIFWGPPGEGKSLLSNLTIGQMHRDDPEAIALKWDTEFREEGQMTKESMAMFGIDPKRYQAWSVNSPSEVFDRFEQDVADLCDQGAPIKLAIIDSITGVKGRRSENATTVDTMQRGDHAATIQDGLKMILAVQRKYRIAVILTAHQRAEQDEKELARHATVRMAAAWGMKHYGEYYLNVRANRNKDGRTDLLERSLRDDSLQDVRLGEGELTARKIHTTVTKSAFGPSGRTGQFTFDFKRGIINVHEEVFLLGVARGIIEVLPGNRFYAFGGNKWNGKAAILEELEKNAEMQSEVLRQLRQKDLAGAWSKDEIPEQGGEG
jgi:hypothetical protein